VEQAVEHRGLIVEVPLDSGTPGVIAFQHRAFRLHSARPHPCKMLLPGDGYTTPHTELFTVMVNALFKALTHVPTKPRLGRSRRESYDCDSRKCLGRGLG
jgi:hypothetical protein